MSSNDTDTPRDPALLRAESARDSVAQAIEGHFERLVAVSRTSRADVDADLRKAGRLMARHTHRQLAANLTLVRRLMEARSVPAVMQVQQDFLRRQTQWLLRDWERAGAQALDLLDEARRAARGGLEPDGPGPAPAPDEPGVTRQDARPHDTGPPEPVPS